MIRSHSTEIPCRRHASTPARNFSASKVRAHVLSAASPTDCGPVSTLTTPARASRAACASSTRSMSTSIVCNRTPRATHGAMSSASRSSRSVVRLNTGSMKLNERMPGVDATASMSAAMRSHEYERMRVSPLPSKQ